MRRFLIICLLLMGSAFLTQTVSASIASYGHCCITECGDADACAMPGCVPCGTPLMATALSHGVDAHLSTGLPASSARQWASRDAVVWRPPD